MRQIRGGKYARPYISAVKVDLLHIASIAVVTQSENSHVIISGWETCAASSFSLNSIHKHMHTQMMIFSHRTPSMVFSKFKATHNSALSRVKDTNKHYDKAQGSGVASWDFILRYGLNMVPKEWLEFSMYKLHVEVESLILLRSRFRQLSWWPITAMNEYLTIVICQ